MEKISQIEVELRQMEAVYARKSSALAKLQEAYHSKLNELIEAKAARDRHTAAETEKPGAKHSVEIV
ncbi:hypothetical protein [Bradyrhizobium sp. USDA 10063]